MRERVREREREREREEKECIYCMQFARGVRSTKPARPCVNIIKCSINNAKISLFHLHMYCMISLSLSLSLSCLLRCVHLDKGGCPCEKSFHLADAFSYPYLFTKSEREAHTHPLLALSPHSMPPSLPLGGLADDISTRAI